jgi:hypothetical protein
MTMQQAVALTDLALEGERINAGGPGSGRHGGGGFGKQQAETAHTFTQHKAAAEYHRDMITKAQHANGGVWNQSAAAHSHAMYMHKAASVPEDNKELNKSNTEYAQETSKAAHKMFSE